jgi:hypothetical protein
VEFSRERLASSINKGGKGNKDTQREKKSFFSALLSQPRKLHAAAPLSTRCLFDGDPQNLSLLLAWFQRKWIICEKNL